MPSVAEIREQFLSFFEDRGHARMASAPLVPESDPTLLFINAGMVPFKTWFTGEAKPDVKRATSSQKCVRAGGKHNDLENVGYTARHHTFFEMLGNFSFGDYFKADAIEHAWTLVTKGFELPQDRLLVTVYSEDEEAAELWRKIAGLPDDRILRISTSDNFWSMGDTGPCGPCSEIFFDHGPDIPGGPPGSADEDGDRFIEIWNLVFMQFDQSKDGTRTDLPKPSIDTGMGLERIAAVLQGVHNNYDIDLFQTLIAAEEEVFSRSARDEDLASFRVIADHLRTSAFLIADGVTPSNEGRGYVLRRIMRRGMRHAHLLGAAEPVLHRLTQTLVSEMGSAFPELKRAQAAIESTLEQEEARFQRTLGRGLVMLEDAAGELPKGGALPGDVAFKLYDTYGFPLDLTADVLRARGLSVDAAGFDAAMAEQKAAAKASWQGSGDAGHDALWQKVAEAHGSTDFCGYETLDESGAPLVALVRAGEVTSSAATGDEVEIVFAKTPFYAESGGQAGDRGEIRFANGRVQVRDVVKRAGLHVHLGEVVDGEISVGDSGDLSVDGERRRRIMSNHSATHLLHAALRNVLGPHVTQKGSLVEADRLRFDFSHTAPVTEAELEAIEAEVNEVIRDNAPADIRVMAPDAAIEAGALALFGEKYGDEVRVLAMGAPRGEDARAYSVELCGGTHVARTGDIAIFTILQESGVSAGVRRIEATTGADALEHLKSEARVAHDVASRLKVPLRDLDSRVTKLLEERRALDAQLAEARKLLAVGGGADTSSAPEEINGVRFIGRVANNVPAKDLRALIDDAKAQLKSGVAAFVAVNDGKAAVSIGVTEDLTETLSAVDLVRLASAAVGGKGGGGRPDMAQAGGPDGDKADAAIEAVRAALAAR